MKKVIFSISLAFLSILYSCEKKSAQLESAYSSEEVVNSIEVETSESELDSKSLNKTPKDKKFKKVVKLSLAVENAYKTTLFIEDALVENGGYILKNRLENQIIDEKIVPISNDSIKKYTKSITTDSIICKVPHEKLSIFLRNLDGKYTRLNFREIKLEDVTQEYVLGTNQNKSADIYLNKMNDALKSGGKLNDKVQAIESLKNYEDEKNNNYYFQANLNNDVKYATVEIELLESEKYSISTQFNNEKYENLKSPTWFRVKESFVKGFIFLKETLILLISVWPLLVILGLVVYFKFFKNKSKF